MHIGAKEVTYKAGRGYSPRHAAIADVFEEANDHSDADGYLVNLTCRGSSGEPFRERQIWIRHEVGGLVMLTLTDTKKLTTEIYLKCSAN
jgi:hypothetical protein